MSGYESDNPQFDHLINNMDAEVIDIRPRETGSEARRLAESYRALRIAEADVVKTGKPEQIAKHRQSLIGAADKLMMHVLRGGS